MDEQRLDKAKADWFESIPYYQGFNMKMYIAVLDNVPDHMVPVLVAHAMLGAHLEATSSRLNMYFYHYNEWLNKSFRKVVVKVNQKEFDKIANLPDVYLAHENTTLEGKKSCAVILSSPELPNVLKFAKLWSPK